MIFRQELKIDKVNIFSDQNAKGIYEKIGAFYLGESPSSIEGRTVSLYELHINLFMDGSGEAYENWINTAF
jgi:hypothetical protein